MSERKGKLIETFEGHSASYYVEYQNIRIDVTDDMRALLINYANDVRRNAEIELNQIGQEDQAKLQRYQQILEIVAPDTTIMG